MSKSLGVKKILSKSVLLGLVASVGLYIASPKIGYLKYNISKEIKQNLDNCNFEIRFEHEDKTTTDIINLMSGVISRDDITSLLVGYGYSKLDLPSGKDIWTYDAALNHAIWHIHEKLGNPKIQFKGDYKNYQSWLINIFLPSSSQHDVYEHDRPRYNFNTNTISIYNLDSAKFDFDMEGYKQEVSKSIFDDQIKIRFDDYGYHKIDPQRVLINNWIAELSHAFQNTKDGFLRPQIDIVKDFFDCGFDYNKTYSMHGMIEYEAHKIYEPEIVKAFINLYIKYTDLGDVNNLYNIAKFYGGYFDAYRDYDLSQFWLEKAALAGKVEAANMLANRAYKLFLENYNDYFIDVGGNDTYIANTIYRYTIADKYSHSKIYAERLIQYCLKYGYNTDLAINYCMDILNKYDMGKDPSINMGLIFHYLYKLQLMENDQCTIEGSRNHEMLIGN